MPPDQVCVPAQHGARQDDQGQPTKLAAGQQPGRHGQDRPVGPRQPRCVDLALEHDDLMAQDQDLGVLGTVGPGERRQPAEHAQRGQRREPQCHEH
jgi:hypothetical protein